LGLTVNAIGFHFVNDASSGRCRPESGRSGHHHAKSAKIEVPFRFRI